MNRFNLTTNLVLLIRKNPFFSSAFFLLQFSILFLFFFPKNAFGEVFEKVERKMGTVVTILVWGEKEEAAQKAIGKAFDEIDRVENLFSSYMENSAISKINQAAGKHPVTVDMEVILTLEKSLDLAKISHGAFDPTFASAGKLYDFKAGNPKVPDVGKIEKAMKSVGIKHLVIDKEKRTVYLDEKGARIGLGGLIKGYAVDRACLILKQNGFTDFIVNAGGDMFVSGAKGNREWKVGIRNPRGGRDSVIAAVRVKDHAIVTSGDYERFFIRDGVRHHHIIDPRTGRPGNLSMSVTIIANTTAMADGLATAIFILGPKKGLELAESLFGVECFIIDANGAWIFSTGFKELGKLEDMREK